MNFYVFNAYKLIFNSYFVEKFKKKW